MINYFTGNERGKSMRKGILKYCLQPVVLVSLLLILFTSNLLALDSNFFGIQIYDFTSATDALYNVKNNGNGGVNYGYDKNLANNAIYCFSKVDDQKITFSITNKSSSSINLLYFTDNFQLITYDEKLYKMEPSEIMDYPDKLEAGVTMSVSFDNPVSSAAKVKFLGANLSSGKLLMFIRRIE